MRARSRRAWCSRLGVHDACKHADRQRNAVLHTSPAPACAALPPQVCNACAEGNSLNTTYGVCMPNPTELDFSQGPEGRRARRMLGAAYPGADDKLCA